MGQIGSHSAPGAVPRLYRAAVCRVFGHTGMIVPAWIGRRPSNTWIFETARCARCGGPRWP